MWRQRDGSTRQLQFILETKVRRLAAHWSMQKTEMEREALGNTMRDVKDKPLVDTLVETLPKAKAEKIS